MTTQPLPTRVCIYCDKSYTPRRKDQKACTTACRRRVTHNGENAHQVINAVLVKNGAYAVTLRYGCYTIRGFLFNPRTHSLRWPRDKTGNPIFRSYGPFWREEDGGLGLISNKLRVLIEKWIDAHDKDLQRRKAEEAERVKAEAEAEQRAYEAKVKYLVPGELCPVCNKRCYKKLVQPSRGEPIWMLWCIDYGHHVRELTEDEIPQEKVSD